MAEEKPADTAPEQSEETQLHKAKVGVKDKGHVVTTAFDEPMSGAIADIADGD
jgi:hypothetical protein